TSEQEQLNSQLYILLGAAEVQNGQLWLPEQLHEPRYNVVDSGLYATVSTPSQTQPEDITSWKQLWQSESISILNITLPYNAIDFRTDQRVMEAAGNYFRLTYDLSWVENDQTTLPLRFQVYHSQQAYKQQVKKYRQQLWYGLSFLAMGLLTIQVIIMRWGLSPLKRLAKELKRLSLGEQSRLAGDYPDEITPVTDSLNEVLQHEQQQRERYRNTLGDLAHSLKTPLAIVQGELQRTDMNTQLANEQLEHMSGIIRHQLQRAVLQTSQKRHTPQAIRPVAERLTNAMSKVYQDKNIHFELNIDGNLRYPIESQDLFELLGNLIENACKYGRDRVEITALDKDKDLLIMVADNGAGIKAQELDIVLQRGARADTAKPGQGIGLAVSTDIVSAYSGGIHVGNSSTLGGAEFQIRLPRD
ncbi:ATP-binding protein, partial [Pseudomaricurvus sp.]|uniref:ATP-binding protein n=1 Tax=Pseudomaricurvus sp. TaxID=2004510 RepID=UPI003F6A89C9